MPIKKYFKGDLSLWVIILLLCLISFVAVYSTSIELADKPSENGNSFSFLLNQVIIVSCGIFIMWVISSFVKPSGILKYARYLLYIFLFLSILVNIPGIGAEVNGASRWLKVPGTGIKINQFDFLRIGVVLDLALQLSKRRNYIYKLRLAPDFSFNLETNLRIIRENTIPILLPSVLAIMVVMMNNFSTALVISLMVIVMLELGNVRRKEIWKLLIYGAVVGTIILAIMYFLGIGRANTAVGRFQAILNPQHENETEQVDFSKSKDEIRKDQFYGYLSDRSTKNSNYQRTLAKIAMSSGGLFGKGPGHSTLRYKLPNSYDDFVYAIIVEEYGLIGGLLVLILYVALFFRGITTASRSRYYSLRLAALGLVIHICITAFIHMMVSTGNIPTTGQALPLISRGGSSFLANSIALGIVLCIGARQQRQNEVETEVKTNLVEVEEKHEDNN